MRSIDYSALRGLKAGALGGLVGAAVLGVLAGLSAFVLDQEVFYVTIATKLGLSSPVVTGWALHFLVGLVAGGVFIAITALLKRFALDTTRKSFWVGLLGGIAIWIVVAAIIGFPFVLALSWFYEWTPNGLQLEYCCMTRNLVEDDAVMQERGTIPRAALELGNKTLAEVSEVQSVRAKLRV